MYTQNDIFLVTGATSGIGRGIALKLLEKGATVIAIGRDFSSLEANKCPSLILEKKDLASDFDSLDKWLRTIAKQYGKLKGLILAAGIHEIIPITSPQFSAKNKQMMETNYLASINIAKGFCDRRVNAGEGSSIVFVSSIASVRGNSGLVSYAASKGAINAAAKSLALEVAKQRIRVNTVLPGTVKTRMLYNSHSEESINALETKHPLGLGEIDDIVESVLFLLSNKARWITGTELVVDGGASI